jgi:hypothetical protein
MSKVTLPPLPQIKLVYALQVSLVFSWVFLLFFYDLPRWLLFLTPLEILVVLAYALSFAFLDSLAFLVLLLVPSLFIYKKYLKEEFVPVLGALSISGYSWIVYLRFLYQRALVKDATWMETRFPLWLLLALASTALVGLLFHRSDRLAGGVRWFAEKAQVFLYLYPPLGVICILVVVVRNWI